MATFIRLAAPADVVDNLLKGGRVITLHRHRLLGIALFGVACGGHGSGPQPGRTPQMETPSEMRPAQFDTAATVAMIAGCYRITGSGTDYLVRLDTVRLDSRISPRWNAEALQPPSENGVGDGWSWTPVDSSHFLIRWGGIDSALGYVVARNDNRFLAKETRYSANNGGGEWTRDAEVSRAGC